MKKIYKPSKKGKTIDNPNFKRNEYEQGCIFEAEGHKLARWVSITRGG